MGKVYATSDWHGCAAPALKLMSYLKEDDTLYFLGDAIDRGKDGMQLFNLLLNDPRVIFIKGNHEDMMEKSMKDFLSYDDKLEFRIFSEDFNIWMWNGGGQTYKDIKKKSVLNIKDILEKLKNMSYKEIYNSPKGHQVILTHAGFSPSADSAPSNGDLLWSREHFCDDWNELDDNIYIVHGHTPVQYLKYEYSYNGASFLTDEEMDRRFSWTDEVNPEDSKIIKYSKNHKIDIDLCTIVSNKVALLDLDTLEVKYFEGEDENEINKMDKEQTS